MRINKKLGILVLIASLSLVSCASPSKEIVEDKEEASETRVHFVGVGDNLIHDTIYDDAKESDGTYDFRKMYSEVKPVIESADIAFINQETILGGEELRLSGYPQFNSPSEIAKNLEDTGFDLVNMATNHSLDRGSAGIANAVEAFSKTNMIYEGVSTSEESSKEIKTFEKDGIKFSFLAYTYGTNGIEPEHDYDISYFNEDRIRAEVADAKKISDVVIVSAHWGDENTFAPSEYQQYYANLFNELEVDVVVGTHPHTIQPIEWKKNADGYETLIIYSLGNFLGGMLSLDNIVGGMVSFDFVKKENDIKIENVTWNTTVIHYELKGDDMMRDRYNYKVYPLEKYTEELAKSHALNGYEGENINLDAINSIVKSVIDEKYIK